MIREVCLMNQTLQDLLQGAPGFLRLTHMPTVKGWEHLQLCVEGFCEPPVDEAAKSIGRFLGIVRTITTDLAWIVTEKQVDVFSNRARGFCQLPEHANGKAEKIAQSVEAFPGTKMLTLSPLFQDLGG